LDDRLATLLSDLDRVTSVDDEQCAACIRRTGWLRTATIDEIDRLFDALLDREPPVDKRADVLLSATLMHVIGRQRDLPDAPTALQFDDPLLDKAVRLYHHLGPNNGSRDYLPCLLSVARTPQALAAFAELTVESPPDDERSVVTMFAPLFQTRDYDPSLLFPRLLDALGHVGVAAVILDLANYVTRCGIASRHPGTERLEELANLLGGIVGHLGRLESTTPTDGEMAKTMSKTINDGVALAVSLCDALALVGDKSVTGKLYQAMDLGHRRLRTEAAAALARLGEEAGVEAMVRLAAEPVSRLRVLAYSEELGVLDKVSEEYQTDEAKAEAELALWLADPAQMGIPPTDCELVDRRTQYWPSYDEPMDCFLFRFTYDLGQAEFSNIGIAGPLAHAFSADLSDLPPDDIYAAFAGWHAKHKEIVEIDAEHANDAQRTDIARLERRLGDEGYAAIQPVTLGLFFGDRTLVAEAVREGAPGHAVVDAERTYWFARGVNRSPLGPHEAYCIYKGRKLLQFFNH